MDRTLILVKPDAFERGLTGEILARFERKGLTIVAMKHMTVDRDAGRASTTPSTTSKPFFGELVDFITGGPLVALVLEGHEAVAAARQVIGATNPLEAAPGSIRGDFGLEVADEPRPRLGLGRVRRARDRAVLPGELAEPDRSSSPRARRSGGRSSSSWGSRSGSRPRTWRSSATASRARSWSRTRCARRGRWPHGRRAVLGVRHASSSDGGCSASRQTRPRRARLPAGALRARPRGAGRASRSVERRTRSAPTWRVDRRCASAS